MTIGGCYLMIEQLEARRLRFQELDRQVSEYGLKAYEKIGFDVARLQTDVGVSVNYSALSQASGTGDQQQ